MLYLKRKIDIFLSEKKERGNHLPVLVTGAPQTGKTESIKEFAKNHYKYSVYIDFKSEPHFKDVFFKGFSVENVIKYTSLRAPELIFKPNETLIIFDGMECYPDVCKTFKSFYEDKRYDIIAAGNPGNSLIEQLSEDYGKDFIHFKLETMDFEEFLWAKSVETNKIESYFDHLINTFPLSPDFGESLFNYYKEFLILGGFPKVLQEYIANDNFSGILNIQKETLDVYKNHFKGSYSEKKAAKLSLLQEKIPEFLSSKYKKYQVTKITPGARAREYEKYIELLKDNNLVNISCGLNQLNQPLNANINPTSYKIYFNDISSLIASLSEDEQANLRKNQNYNILNGALHEHYMADTLKKQGYELCYYRSKKGEIWADFLINDSSHIVPVEIIERKSPSASLKNLIKRDLYSDIRYGIKLTPTDIDFDGRYYTVPYALSFMLKKFISEMGY